MFLAVSLGCKNTSENRKEVYDKITVIGLAENAKAGAIVITKDSLIYYVDRLTEWPTEFYSRQVKVVGYFTIKEGVRPKEGEDTPQQIEGKKKIVKDAVWEILPPSK